jgi:hypothetical protein
MSPEQTWDLIIIAGAAIALVLAVPIAYVIRDKLHERRMRRHFDDTRGRRGKSQRSGVSVGAAFSHWLIAVPEMSRRQQFLQTGNN